MNNKQFNDINAMLKNYAQKAMILYDINVNNAWNHTNISMDPSGKSARECKKFCVN